MQVLLGLIFFVLGSAIGSFLNVVIYRLPRRQPFLAFGERSRCPYCKKTLDQRDLVPIISFIFLHGKCRHCRKHISSQYIIIESLTGALFLTLYLYLGLSASLVYSLVIVAFIIPLFVIDMRHKIIPDALSLPFILAGLAIGLLKDLPWHEVLIGGGIGAGFFALQWVLSKGKWIGSGDIRLGAAMGFLLGWKMLLLALVLAYLIGTVVSLIILLSKKKSLKSTIAFGPYLLLGTVAAYFWGQSILEWYFDIIWYFDTTV